MIIKNTKCVTITKYITNNILFNGIFIQYYQGNYPQNHHQYLY